VREESAFLQHGSVLLHDRQNIVTQVTAGEQIWPASTSISAVLGRSVEFDEVADALVAETQDSWSGSWEKRELPCAALEHAMFADSEWTWRR
jgi:hypothetical protein